LGTLKAKIAMLRRQIIENEKAASGIKGEGFDVEKFGNARVSLIGFPSVGKSSLLNALTPAQSECAAYEFTTVTCIPGILYYNDAKIQLLDLPGIIEGASEGKGKGKQVIAVARSSDMIMMVLDAQKWEEEKAKLTAELEAVGIRLNKQRPDISLRKIASGGVMVNSTAKLTKLDEKMIKSIMHEYKIHNVEVLVRGDYDVDELIDVIEGNRRYIKCLYAYNKIDTISMEEVDYLAKLPNSCPISCKLNLGYDVLMKQIWELLGLIRIYTKKQGCVPKFLEPIILSAHRGGNTIETSLIQIHKSMVDDFKYAFVWGKSVKYSPQRCGLSHPLADEDVIQVLKKSKIA
jgi:small GTP-binding protein